MEKSLICNLVTELSIYDPEEIDIRILNFDTSTTTPFVDLVIKISTVEEEKTGDLRIQFDQLHAACISLIPANDIFYSDDHPLLWDYNDLQASLYFTGVSADVYKLFWEVKQIEKRLYGHYQYIDRYLNSELEVVKLMKAGRGLFANGPKKLLQEMAKVLADNVLKFSLISEREPSLCDGTRLTAKRQYPSALLVGNSYFIANKIDVDFLKYQG
ncbi:hypothetical protein [Chitinophaga sp. Cy-1792]|uniref:hypothetical protein n=1 Tax=Chitinophaga sp. Cy-1792 TaxID=2608339 RepID=UPI00141EF2E2|nr:hypothetical protein [Chitinophaga sp. Cy-1792]NIG55541.1 hypothetical protein [Chitinophaga sp. Cy-1792]